MDKSFIRLLKDGCMVYRQSDLKPFKASIIPLFMPKLFDISKGIVID